MEVVAVARNVRISPEKARLVVAQIRKMPPIQAINVLGFVRKSAAPILIKVIKSAISNARHNFNVAEDNLTFREITVGKGPVFKRFRAVARGRSHAILKRTSHIRVILEGEETKKSPHEESNVKEKKDG